MNYPKVLNLLLLICASMHFCYAEERLYTLDASTIRGLLNNDRYTENVPDSFYTNIKTRFVGKLFIQKHDEPLPYLYRTFDCAKYSINKNDTLRCVDVRKVINFHQRITETPVALVFKAPDGEICWTLLEFSSLYIEDVDIRAAKEAQRKADYRARESAMIRKYGKYNGRLIAQGKVAIGFTKQMCREAWGEPKTIHTTTTRYGVNEQWVYPGGYLYFENGKLRTIQN